MNMRSPFFSLAYQQTLSIRRQVGDKLGEGHTLNNIGLILQRQGRFSATTYFYKDS